VDFAWRQPHLRRLSRDTSIHDCQPNIYQQTLATTPTPAATTNTALSTPCRPLTSSLNSSKLGKTAHGERPLTIEQLSAEIDGAFEEAVEQMVNIGELNVYESSVNVYKYDDDGEGDVINVVASGVN
jgi:hypothetical protein